MDLDQFGGRTDDDLFADDIEPLSYEYEEEAITITPTTTTQPEPIEAPRSPAPEVTPVSPVHAPPPKGLAQSRHNRPNRSRSSNNSKPSAEGPSVPSFSTTSDATAPPPSAPKGPAARLHMQRAHNTASVDSNSRISSGGWTPGTNKKLTDAEYEELKEQRSHTVTKIEQRHQRAQRDEEQHAIAFAKGQEETLRRRQEDAARREEAKRRQEEAARRRAARGEKNRYDAERVQNKDRKGMRAPWDQDKLNRELAVSPTKAANGGVNGSIGSGLGGSRFASQGESYETLQEGNPLQKHGRHGRKLFETEDRHGRSENEQQLSPASASPTTATGQEPKAAEDFPALPSSGSAPTNTVTSPTWVKPVGDWAEDVEV
ncbi:hypothetical protein B0T21DRAFT_417285 [Apiosordaria backusii]|uniref:Uncharacterized protein n=1 Tax=Apiosordaria backusii TaxID=314023 RepID=A0AA39ZPE1_9PEZI|nr:hypothetical protein B0T21DRAFT_417285 [Apiosordaria backusii]